MPSHQKPRAKAMCLPREPQHRTWALVLHAHVWNRARNRQSLLCVSNGSSGSEGVSDRSRKRRLQPNEDVKRTEQAEYSAIQTVQPVILSNTQGRGDPAFADDSSQSSKSGVVVGQILCRRRCRVYRRIRCRNCHPSIMSCGRRYAERSVLHRSGSPGRTVVLRCKGLFQRMKDVGHKTFYDAARKRSERSQWKACARIHDFFP